MLITHVIQNHEVKDIMIPEYLANQVILLFKWKYYATLTNTIPPKCKVLCDEVSSLCLLFLRSLGPQNLF